MQNRSGEGFSGSLRCRENAAVFLLEGSLSAVHGGAVQCDNPITLTYNQS